MIRFLSTGGYGFVGLCPRQINFRYKEEIKERINVHKSLQGRRYTPPSISKGLLRFERSFLVKDRYFLYYSLLNILWAFICMS